ncbi:MAG TPA: PIN domain-containing protein [Microbacteriaceae bacterium]|nr:PIN domain-containing protein [Microbacteriaceae bacterium]
MSLHLDTHVVVWLAAGEVHRIPAATRARLAVEPLRVSPMVKLELAYLREIGRIAASPDEILAELGRSIGLATDGTAFIDVVASAMHLDFTRDAFDRLILAQAITVDALLVTKDERMRTAAPQHTLWH